jgi:hypothetical protein
MSQLKYLFLSSGKELLNHIKKNNKTKIKRINELFKTKNIDINYQDKDGRTALMYAILGNNQNIALKILEKNVDVNLQDKYGSTALMYAILGNNQNIALKILENDNVDLNLQDKDGRTSLMLQDNNGKTALMYAILDNNKYIALKILENDNVDVNLQDKDRKTALIYAILGNNKIIALTILEKNVDVNLQDNNGETILTFVLKRSIMWKSYSYYDDIILKILSNETNIISINETENLGNYLIKSFIFIESYINILIKLIQYKDIDINFLIKKTDFNFSLISIYKFLNIINHIKLQINLNSEKIKNNLYCFIQYFLIQRYFYNNPINNKSLLYKSFIPNIELLFFLQKIYKNEYYVDFYPINVQYLKIFFIKCEEQLNNLFSKKNNRTNNRTNNVLSERPLNLFIQKNNGSYNINKNNNMLKEINKKNERNEMLNDIQYYSELIRLIDIDNKYMIIIRLLIISRINHYTIYLDSKIEIFNELRIFILEQIKKFYLSKNEDFFIFLTNFKDILNKNSSQINKYINQSILNENIFKMCDNKKSIERAFIFLIYFLYKSYKSYYNDGLIGFYISHFTFNNSWEYILINKTLPINIFEKKYKDKYGNTIYDYYFKHYTGNNLIEKIKDIDIDIIIEYDIKDFIDILIRIIKKTTNNLNENKDRDQILCNIIIKYFFFKINSLEYFKKYFLNQNDIIYFKIIKPENGKQLLFFKDTMCNDSILNNDDSFLNNRIKVEYRGSNGILQGINYSTNDSVGGLTKDFFYKCKEQLLKENNFTDIMFILKLLVISKINGCPIYLNINNKSFNTFRENILGMIASDKNFSSLQKIFIINILKKFKDILNNDLDTNRIFGLLLSNKNYDRISNNEKYDLKNIIPNYIIKKRNNIHNSNIENMKKNNSSNESINFLESFFKKYPNIYKYNYIGFYLSHFCFDNVTFELFMKNLKFINKGCDFSNEIIKLLEYMNKNNKEGVLLFARAISGSSLLEKEYTINMYLNLSDNKGFNKPFDFHTCFTSANCYKDAFFKNYLITNDEENNKKVLENFLSFLKIVLETEFLS